jgi:hypothetical protein
MHTRQKGTIPRAKSAGWEMILVVTDINDDDHSLAVRIRNA